jgi:O-antigen/teichoic acid export membrane protein
MTQSAPGQQHSPGLHMLRGSAWMIALRWAIRLTGVVSTVVLARLLTPKDFGVVAIAMIVVGMFQMLSETGQSLAIVRHGNPTREHYDTAWTIQVLIGLGIAAAILIAAPFTKIYFHEPRSILVMQCLALRAVLMGLANIGTVDFSRDLRFDRVFGYNFYAKLFSFTVTITLAVVLRNYWALVAGILCGQLARTVLSYVMHPYRPRISFAKMSEIWSFSIWTFVRAIGSYFITQVDVIAIGGVAGAVSMGRYTMAQDTASSPTNELVGPMTGVLFPVMARYQYDPAELRRLYLRTLGWSAIIGASTGVGVALVAPDMVHLILGSKWVSVIPLMGWLALTVGVGTLNYGAYTMLDVLGMPKIGARLQWLRLAVLAAVLFPVAYWTRELLPIAIARLVVVCMITPTLLIVVGRHTGIRPRDYGAALWRPFAAGGVMALAVWSLNQVLGFAGPVRLGLDILLGMIVYVGTLMALWNASGRPVCAERDVIALIEHAQVLLGTIRARVLKTAQ